MAPDDLRGRPRNQATAKAEGERRGRGPAALLVLLPLLALAVAGCVGYGGTTEFTVPADAGPNARQEGVSDPYVLAVHVVEEHAGGAPVAGAAVVFFVPSIPDGSVEASNVEVEADASPSGDPSGCCGPGSGPGHADGRVRVSTFGTGSGWEVLAAGRAGDDGVVRGHLEPHRTVHLAVGGAEGWTTEVRWRVVLGEAGERGTTTVPLYREELEVSVEDAMPLSLSARKATLGYADREWQTTPLAFREDAQVDKAYRERLVGLDGALHWENTPTRYGDLYAGLSAADAEPFHTGPDRTETPADTDNSAPLEVDRAVLESHRDRYVRRGLSVAAVTDSAAASLDGLPYAFEGHAAFQGSNFIIRS